MGLISSCSYCAHPDAEGSRLSMRKVCSATGPVRLQPLQQKRRLHGNTTHTTLVAAARAPPNEPEDTLFTCSWCSGRKLSARVIARLRASLLPATRSSSAGGSRGGEPPGPAEALGERQRWSNAIQF